jgi:hypothetical protein
VGGATPQLLGTVLTGGAGGCSLEFPPCGGCAPDGQPSVGGCELVAGYPPRLRSASPATGGQTATLAYTGKPGDFVFTLIGLSPAALYCPTSPERWSSRSRRCSSPTARPTAPASSTPWMTLPLLPLGIEAFTVYAQSAAVSAVGAAVLGAPSELTIL